MLAPELLCELVLALVFDLGLKLGVGALKLVLDLLLKELLSCIVIIEFLTEVHSKLGRIVAAVDFDILDASGRLGTVCVHFDDDERLARSNTPKQLS